MAHQNSGATVFVYGKRGCPYTEQAVAWFEKRIPKYGDCLILEVKYLSSTQELPLGRTFPQIFIREEMQLTGKWVSIGGYNDLMARESWVEGNFFTCLGRRGGKSPSITGHPPKGSFSWKAMGLLRN